MNNKVIYFTPINVCVFVGFLMGSIESFNVDRHTGIQPEPPALSPSSFISLCLSLTRPPPPPLSPCLTLQRKTVPTSNTLPPGKKLKFLKSRPRKVGASSPPPGLHVTTDPVFFVCLWWERNTTETISSKGRWRKVYSKSGKTTFSTWIYVHSPISSSRNAWTSHLRPLQYMNNATQSPTHSLLKQPLFFPLYGEETFEHKLSYMRTIPHIR